MRAREVAEGHKLHNVPLCVPPFGTDSFVISVELLHHCGERGKMESSQFTAFLKTLRHFQTLIGRFVTCTHRKSRPAPPPQ
jgi:hypothetical protein